MSGNEQASQEDLAYWAQFDSLRARINNYFAYHRQGLTDQPLGPGGVLPWEDPRRPLMGAAGTRSGSAWDVNYNARPAVRALSNPFVILMLQKEGQVDFRSEARQKTRSRSRSPRKDEFAWVRPQVQGVERLLQLQGLRVELQRILGAGGNGVASLFHVAGQNGRPPVKVVLKSVLDAESSDMEEEMKYTVDMKRSRYAVQMLRWRGEILPADDAAFANPGWMPVDDRKDIMLLEFMENGDMQDLIQKVALSDRDIPDYALWKMLFYLIRACITMYAPPRRQENAQGEETWLDEIGPVLVEKIPDPDVPEKAYNLVHFDLDPQNVLIGSRDDSDHSILPQFKVSDFGLAKRASSSQLTTDPMFAWRYRRIAKEDMYLPEQMHVEWEWVDSLPGLEQPPPRVAGQYGACSNIFAIGLCMLMLMTLSYPPSPPQPIGPLNDAQKTQALLPGTGVITDVSGARVPPFYTHGYSIHEACPRVDQRLKHLLYRCLADIPADRPTLQELVQWTERIQAEMDNNAAGVEAARVWAVAMWGEPPPKESPTAKRKTPGQDDDDFVLGISPSVFPYRLRQQQESASKKQKSNTGQARVTAVFDPSGAERRGPPA